MGFTHPLHHDTLGVAVRDRQVLVSPVIDGERLEDIVLLEIVEIFGLRDRPSRELMPMAPETDEALRLLEIERLKEHTLDDGEDCRIRPDTESKRQDSYQSEAGTAQETAESDLRLFHDESDEMLPRDVAS